MTDLQNHAAWSTGKHDTYIIEIEELLSQETDEIWFFLKYLHMDIFQAYFHEYKIAGTWELTVYKAL
jgi:hypothetical protein